MLECGRPQSLVENAGMKLRLPPSLLVGACYVVAHVAAHHSARFFEVSPGVSVWYPPCGLALAVLVLLGLRFVPLVWLTNVLTAWFSGELSQYDAGVIFPTLITANYALAAVGLRSWLLPSGMLWRPSDTWKFIGVLLLAPLPVAVFGAGLLWAWGFVADESVLTVAAQWWAGDASGLLTIVPTALVIGSLVVRPEHEPECHVPRMTLRRGLLAAVQGLSLVGCLVLVFAFEPLRHYHALYLCFLPLVWIGLHHGLRGATLATLVVTMGGLIGMHETGETRYRVVDFLLFELAAVAVGLGLGAVVTWRRQEEAARLDQQRKILQTQKLESLGVLAGGVAHDFNNLLTAILGNVNLVQMDLPKTSALQVPLAEIEQASTRAANLCRQMMAYAGTGPHRFEEVNLSRLLVEIRPLLGVSLGEPIRLELDLAERLPAIRADAMQLRQVALNVVVNAVEAIEPKPGVIRMSTREASLTTAELRERFQAPDLVGGRYVVWEISDSGCGMSPEVRAHACEPFFTTKFTGQGLGLAAVHGILRSHHGALRVDSVEGRGCTLTLVLPVSTGRS